MKLAHMTWPEVNEVSRDVVVLIPTGSLEQHGPHLPLFTDSILATAAAEAVEARITDHVLLTPTLWLGASGHHLKMSGTLSASFETYMGAIADIVHSLEPHGFYKFFLLNGHGGNNEPNGMALRRLKQENPNLWLGHATYFSFLDGKEANDMEGPLKSIKHACEAETSLMMHLRPELVRQDKLRDDGLYAVPNIRGLVHFFDEITEEGSFGYATLANPEKGRKFFEGCVDQIAIELEQLARGYRLEGG